jgi:hypothetical protein
MDKLDSILNRLDKIPNGIDQLEEKIRGVYLGNKIYLIEEYLYDVSYIFSKFHKSKSGWISNIDIEIKHHQEDSEKVMKAIFDEKLKELMNERVFEIIISITDISVVIKKINS